MSFLSAGSIPTSSLLLHRYFCLCCLLLIALYHHDTQETSNNCGSEENEDDRNADCPHARRKEALEGMVFIDEWLQLMSCESILERYLDIP